VTNTKPTIPKGLTISHPTPEPADSEPCSECTTGYLLHQEYGFADIPAGWTPVQRHDICGRYEGDGDAAEAAARDKGGVAVAFFMADPHYSDLPGDYAIEWVDTEPNLHTPFAHERGI
jgi:hypothetical protein